MANPQRGRLLLVIWPRLMAWQAAALVAFLAASVFIAWYAVTTKSPHPISHVGYALFWVAYFVLFAFPRPLRFYENGVWYTQLPDSMRSGFVSWNRLDRYRFEGDSLILTGSDSTLKGGPVRGGVFRLRPDARTRIEPILAQRLSATSAR